MSYDERLVRAFVDKIYKMKLYSNWSLWIEPHEILEMAPWIDLAFAKKLLSKYFILGNLGITSNSSSLT